MTTQNNSGHPRPQDDRPTEILNHLNGSSPPATVNISPTIAVAKWLENIILGHKEITSDDDIRKAAISLIRATDTLFTAIAGSGIPIKFNQKPFELFQQMLLRSQVPGMDDWLSYWAEQSILFSEWIPGSSDYDPDYKDLSRFHYPRKAEDIIKAIQALPQGESQSKSGNAIDRLIAIAEQAAYFKTPDGNPYADITRDGHRETHPLRSTGFKSWLTRQMFQQHRKVPSREDLTKIIDLFAALAMCGSEEREIYLRTAKHDGKLYLDLGTPDWSAVEIDAAGWRITHDYPVRFRRSSNQRPLPTPVPGGSLDELWELLNVSPDDRVLVAAWLSFCLNPNHPHPILAFNGEQGTGKSSASKLLKAILDPDQVPLLSQPKDDRDLFIAANRRWIPTFDNLSGIRNDFSDALCRISTGAGFATRMLHSDDEEVSFNLIRPIVLNGIGDVGSRPDLLDRMVMVNLDYIPEENRLSDDDWQQRVDAIIPAVLGALLTATSRTLTLLPTVRPKRLPRMADFAKWAIAFEQAQEMEPGTFMTAYQASRDEMLETALERPVATAIIKLLEEQDDWMGTAQDLIRRLELIADGPVVGGKNVQGKTQALGRELKRIQPPLREIGIEICKPPGSRREGRFLSLIKRGKKRHQTSPSLEVSPSKDFDGDVFKNQNVTKTSPSPQTSPQTSPLPRNVTKTSPLKPSHSGNGDVGDVGDTGDTFCGYICTPIQPGQGVRYIGSQSNLSNVCRQKILTVLSVENDSAFVAHEDWPESLWRWIPLTDLEAVPDP